VRIDRPRSLTPATKSPLASRKWCCTRGIAVRPEPPERSWRDPERGGNPGRFLGRPAGTPDVDSTHKGDALTLLGGGCDKVLALGRGDEAERNSRSFLKNLLDRARAGQLPDPDMSEARWFVCGEAGRRDGSSQVGGLLRGTLHPACASMPAPIVDELYRVLRQVGMLANRDSGSMWQPCVRDRASSDLREVSCCSALKTRATSGAVSVLCAEKPSGTGAPLVLDVGPGGAYLRRGRAARPVTASLPCPVRRVVITIACTEGLAGQRVACGIRR